MNPQDLLYTNQFVSTNVINKQELKNETKYYKQFQDHVDKNANISKKYLERNVRDGDPININKMKSKPWPPTNEKNYKPIFSDAVSDVVENKYIKAIRTIISIYSKDRNKEKYLIPNEYIIKLGKEFINIYKIKLIDLNIPNSIPPVNNTNNTIAWIYPTSNILNFTVTGNNLYPFLTSFEKLPDYFFYYSSLNKGSQSLPDKTLSDIEEPKDIYYAIFNQGFYNTKQLEFEMKNKMNDILHTVNEGIVSSYKNLSNTSGNYSANSRLIRNTCHNFSVDINPYTSVCTIMNRAEEIKIIAIQTIPQSTMHSPTYSNINNNNIDSAIDIFWNFFNFVPRTDQVSSTEDSTINQITIMEGKYLFDRNYVFSSFSNYLISQNGDELQGAEIQNMAPSFIITVKDIGVLFGGIDPNNKSKLFEPLTNEDIANYKDNCYPIIFTNMPSIGGINKDLINNVEFFDLYFLTNNVQIVKATNDYERLKTVTSFYYHFDDIKIGSEKFKRYAFYIHTNSFLNRIGYYFKRAGFVNCKTQENMILSESLYNVMGNNSKCAKESQTISDTITDNNLPKVDYQSCLCSESNGSGGISNSSEKICFYGDWITLNNLKYINNIPVCGRGLPFAFRNNIPLNNNSGNISSNDNDANYKCFGKRDSILSLLGWKQNDTRNISNYSPFKFIHRNIDTIETNIDEYSKVVKTNQDTTVNNNTYNQENCIDIQYNFPIIPQDILNIEQISGDIFVFRSLPFIFLRITFPSLPQDTVSNQLIKTTSDRLGNSNMYDDYYDDPRNNLNDLGQNYQTIPMLTNNDIENYTGSNDDHFNEITNELDREQNIETNCGFKTTNELLKKDSSVIFAKINMNAVPGNAYNPVHFDNEFIFYDKPLQSVNTMKIELISPDGKLLNFRQEHNLTLEIMEFRDVLKETLFDTRHGEVVTTGIKKV